MWELVTNRIAITFFDTKTTQTDDNIFFHISGDISTYSRCILFHNSHKQRYMFYKKMETTEHFSRAHLNLKWPSFKSFQTRGFFAIEYYLMLCTCKSERFKLDKFAKKSPRVPQSTLTLMSKGFQKKQTIYFLNEYIHSVVSLKCARLRQFPATQTRLMIQLMISLIWQHSAYLVRTVNGS